jgi:hypothetical protein
METVGSQVLRTIGVLGHGLKDAFVVVAVKKGRVSAAPLGLIG